MDFRSSNCVIAGLQDLSAYPSSSIYSDLHVCDEGCTHYPTIARKKWCIGFFDSDFPNIRCVFPVVIVNISPEAVSFQTGCRELLKYVEDLLSFHFTLLLCLQLRSVVWQFAETSFNPSVRLSASSLPVTGY